MKTHARWLFGTAAIFNISAGVAFLFLRPWLATFIHLDPAHGTNLVLTNFAGAVVALFGYGYLRVAIDPIKYQPYVSFGLDQAPAALAGMFRGENIGKLIVQI